MSSQDPARGADYYYLPQVSSTAPAEWIVAYDAERAHRTGIRNVLLASGQVVGLRQDEFEQAWAAFEMSYVEARKETPRPIPPHSDAPLP